jgi:ubiquinone/menaquinone biosynthesis C-methylase UbiE
MPFFGKKRETPADYWSRYTVAAEPVLGRERSLAHLTWRNLQYPGYQELMPTTGADGLSVLDYGCGPGHDLVGFSEFSRPTQLIGMDVSPLALQMAKDRLGQHNSNAEMVLISEGDVSLPLGDDRIDLIHSSGVLHHTPNCDFILREFHRILKPGGECRIMVYNQASIWFHLYASYIFRLEHRIPWDVPAKEVFRRTTDGPDCPISHCYLPQDFIRMAEEAGFSAVHRGNSIACDELKWLLHRPEALKARDLDQGSRQFLYDLTFNERGWPVHNGAVAGINSTFSLRK